MQGCANIGGIDCMDCKGCSDCGGCGGCGGWSGWSGFCKAPGCATGKALNKVYRLNEGPIIIAFIVLPGMGANEGAMGSMGDVSLAVLVGEACSEPPEAAGVTVHDAGVSGVVGVRCRCFVGGGSTPAAYVECGLFL